MVDITVGEVMKKPVYTTSPDNNIVDAVKEMKKNKVGSLVIVKDEKPIGIITGSDILYKVVAEYKDLEKTKVEKVMSTPLIAVEPERTLKEAGQLMSEKMIEKLPVVEESGKLVGIITTTDLVAYSNEFLDVMINLVVAKQQSMGA